MITDCLEQDGIRVESWWSAHRTMILGMLMAGICFCVFSFVNSRIAVNPLVTIERDIPAFIGKDNTLCYPAQVQITKGELVERWHWDFGQYGDLNGFIQRYTCDTSVSPFSVTCYRQREKFKEYNPDIRPMPRSMVWSWVANTSIRYGVVDEQSRNHGLWIEFLNHQPASAELWDHGYQVGLSKRDIDGQWTTTAKVFGFEMPGDPVADWSEINRGYFNVEYAKMMVGGKHEMIRHDLTLGKIIEPLILNEVELDQYRFTDIGTNTQRSTGR
ncbi:MAG: hypothetical protein QF600_07135 [Verrucomicrobiota bacterium]|nr:hypothetical protein [Verrucomicrobiota bacterium]